MIIFIFSALLVFKFKKQLIFQEEVSVTKFQKVGTRSLISEFSKLVVNIYFAISHDPLSQSNSLSCSEKEFKASGNKTTQMKNSKELRTPGPSFL